MKALIVPSILEHKPTLVGTLVTLRPITADDALPLDQLIRADDQIAKLTGSIHTTGEQLEQDQDELIEIYQRWSTAEDRLVLAIIDNATGHLVGETVFNDWDKGNRSCGFRILIGASGRNRGLGSETTRLMIDYGFKELGLHRISLEVYDFNPRARHVYEMVGFIYEGTGRQALLFDGEWIDVHYMSMLSTDRHHPAT